MSHTVEIRTEVRDPVAIDRACQRLQLPSPTFGSARLYSSTATGWQVQLPHWRFPIVCDVSTGQIKFDNYNGGWGDQQAFDAFLQGYAVEKAAVEARLKGYSVSEQQLDDGSIKLTIHTGASA